MLRGHLGTGGGVDDLAQDVFLRAWHALARWRPARGSFRTWLLAIARNRARDELRRARTRGFASPLQVEPPGKGRPPTEAFPALDAALVALPPDQRTAFLLADVHDLPLGDVAEIEQIPLGTLKSRLDRARKRLRAALEHTRRTHDV